MNSADDEFYKNRSLIEIVLKLSSSNSNDMTAAIRSLGLSSDFLKYLLEQLSGAKEFVKCKPTYHKDVDVVGSTKEIPSGCARTGIVVRKNNYDMFSWLASRHRKRPKLSTIKEDSDGRRSNSLLNEVKCWNKNKTLTNNVGVYRSDIHGRGLFCLRDIEQGENIIEYTGEVSINIFLLLNIIEIQFC
jgi:histone-lysine N-methyltransferase MLL1